MAASVTITLDDVVLDSSSTDESARVRGSSGTGARVENAGRNEVKTSTKEGNALSHSYLPTSASLQQSSSSVVGQDTSAQTSTRHDSTPLLDEQVCNIHG